MDLKEYLDQKTPVKNPTVRLNSKEYRISHSIRVGQDTHSYVLIEDQELVKEFGSLGYLQINKSPSLWTMDKNGNPKSRSVFFIQN